MSQQMLLSTCYMGTCYHAGLAEKTSGHLCLAYSIQATLGSKNKCQEKRTSIESLFNTTWNKLGGLVFFNAIAANFFGLG